MNTRISLSLLLTLSCSAVAQGQKIVAPPVFNIFELVIKQDQNNAYDSLAEKNITASVTDEAGTLAMYSAKKKTNPSVAYMFEIYADSDAYQQHLNSTSYKDFLRNSPDILDASQKRKIDAVPQFLADKNIVQSDKTINNFVIVDVKPEFGQAFRHVVLPEMAQSINLEEGVLAMYAVTDKTNPNRWYFYEIYASEEAYQAHRLTPHFKGYIEQTVEMTTYKEAVAIKPGKLMNKGGLMYEIK
ncbi:antibiotic biosynthesis monooxygenase [Scandinavium sp. TWS1a]|uniref:putative quinol monooxygenase n=1 Tax=Scandinavium tedordense TaxID=2926521 RepID=UPI0021663472|nr:antibiotic biosynthesis monooxygenase [Scandinavium tedordense]MCS2172909.1 antibiotic biosynthesis monooxygenase [Scandinavium tedordense]